MIHTVLQVISKDLDTFLKPKIGGREEVVVVLSELMNNLDGSFAVATENRLICSLFNIEHERVNLNAPLGKTASVNPPFNLNLYVLFAAFYNPARYVDALKAMSLTIGFFQGKQVFNPSNTPGLDPAIEKITVELVNIDMKDMSNFWTALGAKQLPCILCKIRMISITSDMILEEFTAISGIGSDIESRRKEG